MPSRRIEKMSKVIMRSVSDAIMNHLSDPRIEGVISVTHVDLSPDMKNADVFLSIMGADERRESLAFKAIEHASKRIKGLVAKDITAKFSPELHFHIDENYKKTLETLKLIEDVSQEFSENQPEQDLGIEDEGQ